MGARAQGAQGGRGEEQELKQRYHNDPDSLTEQERERAAGLLIRDQRNREKKAAARVQGFKGEELQQRAPPSSSVPVERSERRLGEALGEALERRSTGTLEEADRLRDAKSGACGRHLAVVRRHLVVVRRHLAVTSANGRTHLRVANIASTPRLVASTPRSVASTRTREQPRRRKRRRRTFDGLPGRRGRGRGADERSIQVSPAPGVYPGRHTSSAVVPVARWRL